MAEQSTNTSLQLTTDDLVLLIGEREVQLFQARREQTAAAAARQDCMKMTANVERMRGEVEKSRAAAEERVKAMKLDADKRVQAVEVWGHKATDEANALRDRLAATELLLAEARQRAEKAEAELARRNKRARNLKRGSKAKQG